MYGEIRIDGDFYTGIAVGLTIAFVVVALVSEILRIRAAQRAREQLTKEAREETRVLTYRDAYANRARACVATVYALGWSRGMRDAGANPDAMRVAELQERPATLELLKDFAGIFGDMQARAFGDGVSKFRVALGKRSGIEPRMLDQAAEAAFDELRVQLEEHGVNVVTNTRGGDA